MKKVAMRIFGLLLIVTFVVQAYANCGCLKCSKHLQGMDILGPDGRPVKVIFRRPKPSSCSCSSCKCSCKSCGNNSPGLPSALQAQDLGTSSNYENDIPPADYSGQQYTVTIQAPLPAVPKMPAPLLTNLKYRTDTVLLLQPPCAASNPAPGPFLPYQPTPTASVATAPPLEKLDWHHSEDRLGHKTSYDPNDNICSYPLCTKSKRSIDATENIKYLNFPQNLNDVTFKKQTSSSSRSKRDLAKHGYNFLMNMLPQYIRDPLHHSIQGVHAGPTKRNPDLRQRLEGLKMIKAANTKQNLYGKDFTQASYYYPKTSQLFGVPNQKYKLSFDDDTRYFQNSLNRPRKPLQNQANIFDDSLLATKYTDKKDNFRNLKYPENQPQLTHNSLVPNQYYEENPYLDTKLKYLIQKYNSPQVYQRINDIHTPPSETTLLRKLKKLNRNPFSQDIEDQANKFVEKLLKPNELGNERSKRAVKTSLSKELSRKKRTIVLSSDEIDLPPHYQVELVSAEDEEPEDLTESNEFSGEYDPESPLVGDSVYPGSPYSPYRRAFPLRSKLQPKPDVILGKNMIQKAIREELDAYHRKLEKEQKIKEMRDNLLRKRQQPSPVPQNPIFMLLTAPMKFLKHFHDINKGVNPVMTTLPKLVYTTKKYFRDFGQNFHRNCLNLASDIIGDFDHLQPNIIEQIPRSLGGRYRRDILEAELKKCLEEHADNATEVDTNTENPIKGQSTLKEKQIFYNTKPSLDTNRVIQDTVENTTESSIDKGIELEHFTPDYSLVFKNSKETENFREVPDDNVRKKRYVIKFVDDHEVKDQVEDYLTQKMENQFSYLKPLQEYQERVNSLINNLYDNQQQMVQQTQQYTPHYYPTAVKEELQEDSFEDSFESAPKKRKIQIKKMKPKIIIDNKGLPFMEYDGYKRPLLLNRNKWGLLRKSPPKKENSSEGTGNKIATLIARAKEDSEVVGGVRKEIIPQKIIKERISSLLEEIDQLVHLNPENYDEIFENLLKIQHIKNSIEQDWKRLLIDNRVDDINAKIGLLSKFSDLQQVKDDSVKIIAKELGKNDNEFVRRQLMHCLIRLQKLKCLITSVVEDFEQHLTMKTGFNTKKEIKYVDFLSQLKFASAKTRNDLFRKFCKDREIEGQKNIEMLHKLKKLLLSSAEESEKFDRAAKLIWEMKNLEKMQKQTIQEMNKRLARNYKIKKELKILFDLQKRFEECESELNELLGNFVVKAAFKGDKKKDVKDIIAEIKQKHEELLQKAKERFGGLQILKKS